MEKDRYDVLLEKNPNAVGAANSWNRIRREKGWTNRERNCFLQNLSKQYGLPVSTIRRVADEIRNL